MFYVDEAPIYGRDLIGYLNSARIIRATVDGVQFYPHAPSDLPYEAKYQIRRSSTIDLRLELGPSLVEILTPRTATTLVTGTVTYQADGPFFPPGSPESGSSVELVGDYIRIRIVWDLTISWNGNLTGFECQRIDNGSGATKWKVEAPLEPITAFNRHVVIDSIYDRLSGEWEEVYCSPGNNLYQYRFPGLQTLIKANEFAAEIDKPIYPDGAPFFLYGSRCCAFTMKGGVRVGQYTKATGNYLRTTRIGVHFDRFPTEAGISPYLSTLNYGTVLVKPQAEDLEYCNFDPKGRLKETYHG